MSNSPGEPPVSCPKCGAAIPAGAQTCPLCHGEPPVEGVPQQQRAPAAGYESRVAWQFRLSSMFLWMILLAAVLAVCRMNIGLGILLALLSVPALVRTSRVAVERTVAGGQLSPGDKTRLFLMTLGVMIVVATAAGSAFFAVCAAASLAGYGVGLDAAGFGIAFGVPLGIIAAIGAAWLITWRLWSRSRKIALGDEPKPPEPDKQGKM
jgi:hypothetical protein